MQIQFLPMQTSDKPLTFIGISTPFTWAATPLPRAKAVQHQADADGGSIHDTPLSTESTSEAVAAFTNKDANKRCVLLDISEHVIQRSAVMLQWQQGNTPDVDNDWTGRLGCLCSHSVLECYQALNV